MTDWKTWKPGGERDPVVEAVEKAHGSGEGRRGGPVDVEAVLPPVTWTDADEEWVEKVPAELRGIARRYGRETFSLVMRVGAATHAVGLLARRTAGNREQGQALAVLAKAFQDLASAYLRVKELTSAFRACQKDVELMGELAQNGEERRSAGGIILDS